MRFLTNWACCYDDPGSSGLLGSGATAGHVPVHPPFKVLGRPHTMVATQEGNQT